MKFLMKFLISCAALTSIVFAQSNQNSIHQEYLKAKKIADQQNIKWSDLNNALVAAIDAMNKQLPKKIDNVTTLTKAKYFPNKKLLKYEGVISGLNKEIYEALKKEPNKFLKFFKQTLQTNQARQLCINPNIIYFFEHGGKIKYEYEIKDKNIPTYNVQTDIDANVCKKLNIW
jgi:hypothetical protein